MVRRMSGRWTRSPYVAFLAAVLWIGTLEACGAARASRPTEGRFADDTLSCRPSSRLPSALVPAVPVPIRLGTNLGFRLSSGSAGYASLYLIDPADEVWVLAENLPLAAGSLDYPSSAQGFTLTAAEPLGVNRLILLITAGPDRRLLWWRHFEHGGEPGDPQQRVRGPVERHDPRLAAVGLGH